MTVADLYDYKRTVLGDEYDAAEPVRNWLRYRLIAKQKGVDCDRIAMARELAEVSSAGARASADTMNSFWTTYARAIELRTGTTVTSADTQMLLDRRHADGYREINEQFAEFAILTHTRGNFVLVPMYLPHGALRYRSLNPIRGGYRSKWRDYWDRTLSSIRDGEFDDFFVDNPPHEQFDIPLLGGFDAYVRRHNLGAYIDERGEVMPLWPGHLEAGSPALPATDDDICAFLENVTRAITQRAAEPTTSRLRHT